MKRYYKIGEIAALYSVSPDSLRYYEEIGLLTPRRDANGYRMYSIEDIWRLNVIRDMLKPVSYTHLRKPSAIMLQQVRHAFICPAIKGRA